MSYEIINSDCLKAMQEMPDGCIDAIVTDPPYGLAFMGAKWDSFNGSSGRQTTKERQDEGRRYAAENKGAPRYGNSHGKKVTRDEMVAFQGAMTPIFEEALRVAKPGSHILCFGGTRTFHRLACSLEDAGWEIRDTIMWVYGCLDEETEVLVDGEFVPYNKAKKGRLALGYDIGTGNFSWQRIEDTYLYDYDDTAYAIQSDSTDQLVSRNHRCIVERGGVEQFAFAEQVAQEREACVPILEGLHGLLDRLPLPDERTGNEEQDLLAGVRGEGGEPSAKEAQEARAEHDMPSMREGVLHTDGMEAEGKDKLLFEELQGQGGERTKATGVQHGTPNANVRGAEASPQRANDGATESSMEGRGDIPPQPRELQGREIRQVSQGVLGDGTQGRVRDGAQACGGSGDREAADKAGVRASRQPRPAGQQARESDAVPVERGSQDLRELWGAKSTLARVAPTHYKGKMWCVKVRTGAFVARRHGKIFITGNSGFPKSMDVAKAIDKQRRDDPRPVCRYLRDAIERSNETTATIAEKFGFNRRMVEHWAARDTDSQPAVPTIEQWVSLKDILGLDSSMDAEVERLNERKGEFGDDYKNAEILGTHKGDAPGLAGERFTHVDKMIRAPHSDAAKEWQGWGTCLKPAWEPIIVARKPLDGTVAHNVMTYGTGAINIDGCRVPHSENLLKGRTDKSMHQTGGNTKAFDRPCKHDEEWQKECVDRMKIHLRKSNELGRFPANLVHDGSQEVLELFPDSKGQQGKVAGNEPSRTGDNGIYGHYGQRNEFVPRGDSGSAARFFYCAKASKKDRNSGCEDLITWEHDQELTRLLEQSSQLLKDISECTTLSQGAERCSTSLFGNSTMGLSQTECRFITSTVIKLTTESKTCDSSQRLSINESILDAIRTSEESGISLARLADKLRSLRLDSTKEETDSAINAVSALFDALSEIRNCARKGNLHPTVKPNALMRWLVRLVCPQGGTVLDPFMGSGSTGVACIQEGMRFVGIEMDEHYCEIAEKRIGAEPDTVFAEV